MGTIAGVVTTTDGEPIPDASVFVASGPPHADLAALTDEIGEYRLSGLQEGTYVLQVSAQGFTPVSGRVPVRPRRGVTRADVTLESEEVFEIESDNDREAAATPGDNRPSTSPNVRARRGAPRRSQAGAGGNDPKV